MSDRCLVIRLTNTNQLDLAYLCQSKLVPEDSDDEYGFSGLRDSFHILATMNQYSLTTQAIRLRREAETLLRTALFSKDLPLRGDERTLKVYRKELATNLRRGRKRGAVMVYISTLWFLFAMAISISQAFDTVGSNSTAHDLALGCLLAWEPVLILSTIVDRNFDNPEQVCEHLNALIDRIRRSLQDPATRESYIETFENMPGARSVRERFDLIQASNDSLENFFVSSDSNPCGAP